MKLAKVLLGVNLLEMTKLQADLMQALPPVGCYDRKPQVGISNHGLFQEVKGSFTTQHVSYFEAHSC